MHISFNWKVTMTLILSLFVFTAYNNDVSATAKDIVQTEFLLPKDFFQIDLTIPFGNSIHCDVSCSGILVFDTNNLYPEKYCGYSKLMVKTHLTSFISYKNNTCSFWELPRNQTGSRTENDVFIL